MLNHSHSESLSTLSTSRGWLIILNAHKDRSRDVESVLDAARLKWFNIDSKHISCVSSVTWTTLVQTLIASSGDKSVGVCSCGVFGRACTLFMQSSEASNTSGVGCGTGAWQHARADACWEWGTIGRHWVSKVHAQLVCHNPVYGGWPRIQLVRGGHYCHYQRTQTWRLHCTPWVCSASTCWSTSGTLFLLYVSIGCIVWCKHWRLKLMKTQTQLSLCAHPTWGCVCYSIESVNYEQLAANRSFIIKISQHALRKWPCNHRPFRVEGHMNNKIRKNLIVVWGHN